MSRAAWASLACVAVLATACARIPPDSLRLDHGVLTVDNQTTVAWTDVEIWVNRYFRVAVPAIAAKSKFQVPLNAFVSGYAQRFDPRRALVDDLRLTAKQADGQSVTLVLSPPASGLAALKGKK